MRHGRAQVEHRRRAQERAQLDEVVPEIEVARTGDVEAHRAPLGKERQPEHGSEAGGEHDCGDVTPPAPYPIDEHAAPGQPRREQAGADERHQVVTEHERRQRQRRARHIARRRQGAIECEKYPRQDAERQEFGGIPAHERIDEQHVGRENVGGCGHDAARSTEVLAREEEYATRRRHESQHEDDLHGVNDVQNWYERDRANGIISERRVVVEDRVSVAVVEVGRPTRVRERALG